MTQRRQGVYIITNTKNGRKYIGSSNNIDARLKTHFEQLNEGRHKNYRLQNERNNDAYLITEVHEYPDLDRDQLFDKEQEYLNERQPELNISPFAKPRTWQKWKKKHHEKKLTRKQRKKLKKQQKKEARQHRHKVPKPLLPKKAKDRRFYRKPLRK